MRCIKRLAIREKGISLILEFLKVKLLDFVIYEQFLETDPRQANLSSTMNLSSNLLKEPKITTPTQADPDPSLPPGTDHQTSILWAEHLCSTGH